VFRVVGIVGYKNSGKTTLAQAVSQELAARGYTVAVIKHSSHYLDLAGKDTAVLGRFADPVGIISPHESGIFWRRPLSLEDMIRHVAADIVLVEGFKTEKTFPKILCLRGKPDDRTLFDGLAICAVGPLGRVAGSDVPVLDRDDVSRIADLVEQKGFKLPGLDCGGCGHERCYDLAREIVAGTGRPEDCVPVRSGDVLDADEAQTGSL
jgi:molybdopterin-guanine dinucleotide biosynthesis protein B